MKTSSHGSAMTPQGGSSDTGYALDDSFELLLRSYRMLTHSLFLLSKYLDNGNINNNDNNHRHSCCRGNRHSHYYYYHCYYQL